MYNVLGSHCCHQLQLEEILLKKSLIRDTFFIISGTVIASLIITFVGNILLHDGRTLFYNYIDYIYFVNLPLFVVGAMMFITERGLFNVFIYSTNKVRSVVSSKYRYTLLESEDVDASEMDEFLKNKYLYADHQFDWTMPLFLGSSTLYGAIILVISLYYGI